MYKLVLKRFVLVVTIISAIGVAAAQSPDPIKEMSLVLMEVDALVDNCKSERVADDVSTLSIEQVESKEVEAWVEAQKSSYTSSSGLELRAGYERKYGTGSDDIYDDLYAYKNRFDAMLSWNILRSGLVGRKSNAELVELEGQKMLLDEMSVLSSEQIRIHAQRQQQVLSGYRNYIYNTQIRVYTSLEKLLRALYLQGQATTMEISQLEMELNIARGALRETPINVESLFSISDYLSSQQSISDKDIESLALSSAEVEQSKLNEKILGNEIEGVSYWDGARVSPYAKAQHYSDNGFATSRMTANIGVSVTLPILSGTKSRLAEVQARSSLAANKTLSTSMSVSILIEDCAVQLNKNMERLETIAKLEELYKEHIKNARKAYEQKQLTMRELSQYYLRLLTLQSNAVELISDRESLKVKLLLITL